MATISGALNGANEDGSPDRDYIRLDFPDGEYAVEYEDSDGIEMVGAFIINDTQTHETIADNLGAYQVADRATGFTLPLWESSEGESLRVFVAAYYQGLADTRVFYTLTFTDRTP